ncbi:MAG: hypothetical protein ACOYB3_00260 [Azonexus sp.]
MSERKQVPIKLESKSDGNVEESHPSFGLIGVSHYTCTPPQNFFGSSIRHNAGVSLSISRAVKHRNLSNTWYHGKDEIIEVNMTQAQWAELLSSFNRGPGVPCTLNHVNRNAANDYVEMGVPACPETNERQEIEIEFKREMRKLTDGMKALLEKAASFQDKPSINKADRKEFLDIATTLNRKIDSCMPFIQGQFNEAMDGIVVAAKADIESFTSQLLRQAGIGVFQEKVAALSDAATRQIEDSKPVV